MPTIAMKTSQITNESYQEATFRLSDYLGPRGAYKYETLAPTMEEYRRLGYRVVLISVPGFVMAIGFPESSDYPWVHSPWMYKTAADIISLKNGVQMDG